MIIPIYESKENTAVYRTTSATIEFTPFGLISAPGRVTLQFAAGRAYTDTIPVNYNKLTTEQKHAILYGAGNYDGRAFTNSKAYALAQ